MYEWSMQAQYHGGFQKGRETGRTEGRIEGKAEGRAEGEEALGKLTSVLVDNNRYEDVKRAAEDAEYRKQLYKEYNI